jgi:DNA-binding NtrC family response regulator
MDHQARILLVDDDSAVIDSYLRVLQQYTPLRASNGLEAQKILSETTVDVVLCDLEMPLMNGLDLMRWAKENCPHALWIVVTGAGTFDEGHSVVVDRAACTMLDSTMLGTLHELVVRAEPRASLRVQSADENIRGLFEELAMTQVLTALAPNPRSVPATMIDLHAHGDDAQSLVLHAHELLADLSAKNAAQFQPVIDALHG